MRRDQRPNPSRLHARPRNDQESFGAGGDYRGDRDFGGFSDQDYGSQGYSGQGYGDRSYGDPDYGGQTYSRRGGRGPRGDYADGPTPGVTHFDARDDGHRESYARHGRGYGDQGFGGLAYGDHGSAPASSGIGQGYGGQNYDGMGRPQQTPAYMTSQRGVGPKGWKRTDERIHEDVCERLADDHHLDASDIDVTCSDGVVTLSGRVKNRRDKRHAEDIAASARGVHDVVNQLTLAQTRRPDREDEDAGRST